MIFLNSLLLGTSNIQTPKSPEQHQGTLSPLYYGRSPSSSPSPSSSYTTPSSTGGSWPPPSIASTSWISFFVHSLGYILVAGLVIGSLGYLFGMGSYYNQHWGQIREDKVPVQPITYPDNIPNQLEPGKYDEIYRYVFHLYPYNPISTTI